MFCIWSFRSQISIMGLSCVSWPISAFNCRVNMTSVSAGTIFSMEVVRHRRVIQWLWGFTKFHKYASQISLKICLITSSFSSVARLHYSSSCFTLGRKPGLDSTIRLFLCKFSLFDDIVWYCCRIYYFLFCLFKLRIPIHK